MLVKTQEECPDMSANFENCQYLNQYKDEESAQKCRVQMDKTAMMVDEVSAAIPYPLCFIYLGGRPRVHQRMDSTVQYRTVQY